MAFSEFIRREIERIVASWEEFARTRLPAAQHLSSEDLRDHAKVLLLSIAADMEAEQSSMEQQAKSRGERPENAPEVTRYAREHAEHRFSEGFTLNEMVAEYRALRASVLRLWAQQRTGTDSSMLDQLIRFDEALDQGLTESIAWYSRRIEDSRNLLLGVLGHDLRNPLGAIRRSAQYLLLSDTLDGLQTKAVTRILNSTNRMREMVGDLLDFTRTRLGNGLPLVRGPGNLGEVCRQVVDELEAFHPERTLHLHCSGELSGCWDTRRVGQLVSNLVSNAIHHGQPEKPVTVVVCGDADAVTVSVHNEGPPIAVQARKTLFEPLKRASLQAGESREGASGLGLGLYIARQIAVAHGGSIEVDSSELGGTAFTARLPRQAQEGRPPASQPA
ncbi:ATP-binding protein [Caldimonas tepidiphila]|uniref:ATP-binding protein n=1 Tax=Caldimonas tepidiphila TaxID=2315841 RepID=UPI001472E139|nr:sensor histidine kinase [Caldimonas tepidiphila]